MQLALPRVSPRHRLLAGAVLLASATAAAVLSLRPGWELFLLARPPACLMKVFAGVPCLACRGTRAALALAHGQLGNALRLNPLATVFLIGTAGYLAQIGLAGRGLAVKLTRLESTLFWIALALALAGNWIYVISQGG